MPKVLIVDDESVDRESARRYLAPIDDLEIIEAKDGVEALEKVERESPDLVLTDLRMPRMDGIELAEQIKNDFPLVPIILMTSHGNEQIAVRALRAGASSYVSKGDLKETLVETVDQILEVAAARRSRHTALQYLSRSETEFKLENELELIAPVIGFFQENLERLAFGDDNVRTRIGIALMEALSNAIIHGNLEVSSELRRDRKKDYDKMIVERRKEAPYAERQVWFRAEESAQAVRYVVVDEGPGFDPGQLPDPTAPENMARSSGRGILLIRTFMDEVHYNERGNEVTMIKHNPRAAPSDVS